jgi:hypothetical protein
MQSIKNSGAQAKWVDCQAINQVRILFHLGAAGTGKRAEDGSAADADGLIRLDKSLGSGGKQTVVPEKLAPDGIDGATGLPRDSKTWATG